MILPMEILERIVVNGLDSVETARAWSKLSPSFQTQVTKHLGILVISDCAITDELDPKRSFAESKLLEYMSLSGVENTLSMNIERFDKTQLREFLQKYQNFMFVVVTDEHFSERVWTCLSCVIEQIASIDAAHCKNISMIYKTGRNYLSKINFRGLLRYPWLIRLCELHLLSGSDLAEHDNIDLDLVFETTNLYNVKRLLSLTVQDPSHVLRAPNLVSIRDLELSRNVNPVKALAYAPLLSRIQNFRIPTDMDPQLHYRLPACDELGLVNYSSTSVSPYLDGRGVREHLKIITSVRNESGVLRNMNFSRVKKLSVSTLNSSVGEVEFQNCDFSQLRFYDGSQASGPTKWRTLRASNAKIDSVRISLNSCDDLLAFMSCPFELSGTVELTSKSKGTNTASAACELSTVERRTHLTTLLANCSRIVMNLNSVWQCVILHHIVKPHMPATALICLDINFEALQDDIRHCCEELGKSRSELFCLVHLPSEDGIIQVQVPQAKRATILDATPNSVKSKTFSFAERALGIDEMNSNTTIHTSVSQLQDPVSPTEFRRNSLAGSDSETARRHSIVHIGVPPYLHAQAESARSSISGDDQLLPPSLHQNDSNEWWRELLTLTHVRGTPLNLEITEDILNYCTAEEGHLFEAATVRVISKRTIGNGRSGENNDFATSSVIFEALQKLRDLGFKHPNAASFEYFVPIARGGDSRRLRQETKDKISHLVYVESGKHCETIDAILDNESCVLLRSFLGENKA
ncbi:LAFA_0E04632g1_1 [Lachancea sp. 'fantastica']|nr:LAFA_0E04632g1_1 [Lachancea sp. 'fantastica']